MERLEVRGEAESAAAAEAGVGGRHQPLLLARVGMVVADAFLACRRASSEGSDCGDVALSECATEGAADAEVGLAVTETVAAAVAVEEEGTTAAECEASMAASIAAQRVHGSSGAGCRHSEESAVYSREREERRS